MNRTASIFTALLALLIVTCVVLAQDQVISVDVDVVLIPTTVTNDRGQYVGGLDKENFTIFEDRVQQEITYFSTEDAPMSLGIVLDASGSMNQITATARRNGGGCMSAGTTDDQYFLIVFSDKLKVNTDFTSDLRSLRSALLTVNSKGSTALYDAIYAGLQKVRGGLNPRKALVVVSDGYDNHSRYSGRNVREAFRETDVQLYLIGNEGDGGLRELADSTGGRSLSSRVRNFELGTICNEIVRNLKNQYLLGYHSSNAAKDGKWRNVSVKLNAPDGIKLNLRSRTGYHAPKDTETTQR